jgi:leucyl aminopeptidase
MIIQMKLPVKLRLLLPIVENSISGNALRPGDVIRARNGKTTEITNTDAEGRLILADVLHAAVEDSNPQLVVDFATLTGAARVALGNDLPALFSNNQEAMTKLWNLSHEINDPMWMMPLWEPLRSTLKSNIADLVNAGEGGGGAIIAALYLSEFLTKPTKKDEEGGTTDDDSKAKKPIWFHIDFMGTKNGVAEPQGMRSIYEYINRELIVKEDK